MDNEITAELNNIQKTRILINKSIPLVLYNRNERKKQFSRLVTARELKDYADNAGLIGKELRFEEYQYNILFTPATLKKSITQMNKKGFPLSNLCKLLLVIEDVCKNAIKVSVEPYNATGPNNKDQQVHHFISAFRGNHRVYPVKIIIYERSVPSAVFIVGNGRVIQTKSEALTSTGTIYQQLDKGSLFDGRTSLTISLPLLIANFNKKDSAFIKVLPDGVLTEKQSWIKQKTLNDDRLKKAKSQLKASGINIAQAKAQDFSNQEITTILRNAKEISLYSSTQLSLEKKGLSNNMTEIKTQAKEISESAREQRSFEVNR